MPDRAARVIIGDPGGVRAGDLFVGLDLAGLRTAAAAGAAVLPLHQVTDQDQVADEIRITVPPYRGHRFVEWLDWLVCSHLARPSVTTVTWSVDKQGGPKSIARRLADRGWELSVARAGGRTELTGSAPEPALPPPPRSYEVDRGGRTTTFAADWGTFSGTGIDAGTDQLLDHARELSPRTVLDVGTGVGILAILLALDGATAGATEVDSVALLLAKMNALAANVDLDVALEDRPELLPRTDLTVCNVPTHLHRQASDDLIRGLTARADQGSVLVVVHASLEQRYLASFAQAGGVATVRSRATHAVLDIATAPSRR